MQYFKRLTFAGARYVDSFLWRQRNDETGVPEQALGEECQMSMKKSSKSVVLFAFLLAILLSGVAYAAQSQSGDDRGESRESKALKNRRSAPGHNSIDKTVTLNSLLDKKNEGDWSTSRAAVIEGYVIQIEKEADGDIHMFLAVDNRENNTNKWIIVEIPPYWRTRNASLSPNRINKLHGKRVRVTGWLYYEPDANQGDPRGTRWELHPVTDITVLEK